VFKGDFDEEIGGSPDDANNEKEQQRFSGHQVSVVEETARKQEKLRNKTPDPGTFVALARG
jgi:hypothetical protein